MKPVFAKLNRANRAFGKIYPGEPATRQPVHTVYGGAHLFSSEIVSKFSHSALETLKKNAPNSAALARALTGQEGDAELWSKVYERVVKKLKTEPVEDFRIDFEDGYGTRADAEEDGHAVSAATEVARAFAEKKLPPFIGIRIKPFTEACAPRAALTLELFLGALLAETGRKLPDNFVVTLPKVTIPQQTEALTRLFAHLEKKFKLAKGSLKFEIMVETTQSIMDADGKCPLRAFVEAGEGRCTGAHFGTYDYTAGNNITAGFQAMKHPACDFAKQMMKVALTGTGVLLSDGATNVMPVGDEKTVHRAWRLSYEHIQHSLVTGFYQGWDLHPAQLAVRYAATYAFFLSGLVAATERLKGFVDKAARATLLGDVFDDAATGQGLLNFFLRGLTCGALTEGEALATGVTLAEFESRSFVTILNNRAQKK